jgi:DNA replicative helicase MCM subunit Mcm2 (Cdc46/Mcm family)
MVSFINLLKLEVLSELKKNNVTCEKCGHHWDIEPDENEPYLCHKCDFDNKKKQFIDEKWSQKYKKSINCNNPKGFSQRAHCQGRKKRKK